LFGYILCVVGLATGTVNVEYAVLFFAVAIGYGTLLSFWAIVLEEFSFRRYPRFRDLVLMCVFALVESIGYRQLTVWFRVQAFWKFLRKDHAWGAMQRQGVVPKPPAGEANP